MNSRAPISHPAEGSEEATLLRDHLDEVAERVCDMLPAHATTIAGESLAEMAAIVAQCHDFGKTTTDFQTYVRDDSIENGPTHSLFGAYLGYYVLDQLDYDSEDCLVGFVAIAKHHGRLADTGDYIKGVSWFENNEESNNKQQHDVIEQVQNVDDHWRTFAREFVADLTDGAGSWDEFTAEMDHFEGQSDDQSLFETVEEHVDDYNFETDRRRPSTAFYQQFLQLWSGLVLADKTSAAGIEDRHLDAGELEMEVLSEHIDDLGGDAEDGTQADSLDDLREEARREVLDRVEQFVDTEGAVATLTLPTGMGKTMTGLEAAFELRERLGGERIVYALPFTSVIDQVADDLMDVFASDGSDDRLTIHHHLAETLTVLDEERDDETDEDARLAEMVAESWRSNVTLTTFVQLFESLVGPVNSQSMKLPALYDAVIVLDEPQALPMKWWKLVRRLASILDKEYNATVVAMTATQPALFDDAFELVADEERYFEEFDRVEYAVHDSVLSFDNTDATLDYEGAAATILDETGTTESTLAICNTIDSAGALTDAIEEQTTVVDVGACLTAALDDDSDSGDGVGGAVDDDESNSDGVDVDALVERVTTQTGADERVLVHLSTRLRPRDRFALIEATQQLIDRDMSLVVVSTQLIEAGVDISFDRVYRDIAPIDSVVQAAGRCNRSFERDRGTVTLWWLGAPEGTTKTPAQAVYNSRGVSTISITSQTLDAIGAIEGAVPEQTMTREAIMHYYDVVADRDPGDPEYVDWVDEAEGTKLGRLSLIDKRESVDVIVCRTDDDRELVDAMVAALDEFDYDTFGDHRDEAKDITVSLPIYSQDSTEAETVTDLKEFDDTGLCFLRHPQSKTYFDAAKGLAVEGPSVDDRFL
ncbi:CRISPR-associated endonuclease Cas3'' [Halomicrobium mukohataei]|uniref:CRISPR-associated endonuclease Cas3 n=1 Tax=Halomicrobium mukohataei TaxID=57705 RepID=A0A847UHX5_9EURY|nr:CRISPR-associated endonuclease Cas3'' [Halomicrobium mukohataei]NLV11154.1 CRISPR-associated endonuclease Cas3'' [Halomicrobium mukohataei]